MTSDFGHSLFQNGNLVTINSQHVNDVKTKHHYDAGIHYEGKGHQRTSAPRQQDVGDCAVLVHDNLQQCP